MTSLSVPVLSVVSMRMSGAWSFTSRTLTTTRVLPLSEPSAAPSRATTCRLIGSRWASASSATRCAMTPVLLSTLNRWPKFALLQNNSSNNNNYHHYCCCCCCCCWTDDQKLPGMAPTTSKKLLRLPRRPGHLHCTQCHQFDIVIHSGDPCLHFSCCSCYVLIRLRWNQRRHENWKQFAGQNVAISYSQ